MLKLPKGLKKKKKGKKSKKDQELFTEEELKQYKREHQQQPIRQPEEQQEESVSDTESKSTHPNEEKAEADEEWSKFKALTAGVDSILHKTQDDLDRIKSTSFFQRVPTTSEQKKLDEEKAAILKAEQLEQERLRKAEVEANRDILAEAVVELSDSEEESEEADDIFATDYIDAITSGEIQLGIVPDSPDFEFDDGPDPFDTSYADKLIKGPEVSKRGKKLVSIGAAVEVLTGRVETVQSTTGSIKRKPRRGPQNLLLDDFGDIEAVGGSLDVEESVTPEPPKTLLDDPADELPDIPIDLSVSLHLTLQKEQQQNKQQDEEKPIDILSEFDVLKDDEDDEFAELAVESLTKKEEITVLSQPQPLEFTGEVSSNWAEFEQQLPEEVQEKVEVKAKPPRPPPVHSAVHSNLSELAQNESDEEFNLPEDDPFDTTFAEKVLPGKEEGDDDEDFDFDPRAEEKKVPTPTVEVAQTDLLGGSNPDLTSIDPTVNLLTIVQKDLLGGSTTDLSTLAQAPITPVARITSEEVEDFDPFDTSGVSNLVKPRATELKFLEKELLTDTGIKHSLSDPDFDPRAEEFAKQPTVIEQIPPQIDFDQARRKSSLSLNITSKSVVFLVPENDLLSVDHEGGKVQKPLTPYYIKANPIEEKSEDPFDTSFVPDSKPTKVELNLLEKDLLTSTNLKHSLSDPDFDPRADDTAGSIKSKEIESDLLAVNEQINIKVLTPGLEIKDLSEDKEEDRYLDPFDTSIAVNILPGKAELKLIEKELLPATTPAVTTGVLDTLTDAQELGLGDKVLTPQIPFAATNSIEEVDPFDTSFANNLGPGKTEIKILENELIQN